MHFILLVISIFLFVPTTFARECDEACISHAERAADHAQEMHDRAMERHDRLMEQERQQAIQRGGCGVTFWNLQEAKRSCKKGRLHKGETFFGNFYYACVCKSRK